MDIKQKLRYFSIKIALLLALLTNNVIAHPGTTDSNRGHVDRSTGDYHCHTDGCVQPYPEIERAGDEEGALEEITVTGSRIPQGEYEVEEIGDPCLINPSLPVCG